MNVSGPSDSPRRGAIAAAARWRLPFSRQAWRGLAGNWLGAGAGSSLDFQDHRAYTPGDDPRHIHWQAYARTGALTMKLYRAEVAPLIDIVVDASGSMVCTPEKQARTDELVAFCVECADRAGASVRLHAVSGRSVQALATEDVRADRWRSRLVAGQGSRGPRQPKGGVASPAPPDQTVRPANQIDVPIETSIWSEPRPSPTSPALSLHVSWRPGAMKVLVSDLLFPGDPSSILVPLAAGAGIGVVLAPALADEADLPWRGNVELVDCESDQKRRQRIDEPLAARYRAAYERHFELWRDACRKRGVLFGRVGCERSLSQALAAEPFAAGAIEPVA